MGQDTDISQFDSPGKTKRGSAHFDLTVDHAFEIALGRGP